MNAIARFVSLGAQDADRRVAAALSRPPLEPADRYVKDSTVVAAVDRVTWLLPVWWTASESGRLLTCAVDGFVRAPGHQRHRDVAVTVLTAAIVHVALTIAQGPRPGWFWMVVPIMTTLFALLLLAGTRSTQSSD